MKQDNFNLDSCNFLSTRLFSEPFFLQPGSFQSHHLPKDSPNTCILVVITIYLLEEQISAKKKEFMVTVV